MKQIILQSVKENLVRAEDLICDICDEYHIQNHMGVISMAVLKAVENAIHHGNCDDASKKVTISWGHSKGCIFFEIEDEGCGFDFASYGDFPVEQNCGEGIFMMKTLADQVIFSNGGSKVRLEFVVDGIDSTEQLERSSLLQQFYRMDTVHA